ncbi:MAG: putative toxin-antitoxin system toxin component, PIN family [Cyanobacteria bacterium P01_A01_bin.40]
MVTKIVVDTNVFVSVLIGREGSAAREVLRRCLQGNYQPLMGNALFTEYQDVMNRDEIKAKCPLTESEAKDLLADFMSVCQWVKIFYLWRPNLKDEADNHLIELAIAGNAQIIVTRNINDFKRSQLQFPQIKILKPEEIL